jgi:hypothetical protein
MPYRDFDPICAFHSWIVVVSRYRPLPMDSILLTDGKSARIVMHVELVAPRQWSERRVPYLSFG